MEKIKVQALLIEDNPADIIFLREALAKDALAVYQLTVTETLEEALGRLAEKKFDVILLDLGLPDSQGLPTLRRLRQAAPVTPTLILSALADEQMSLMALQEGAQDYLVKNPQEYSLSPRAIRYALERQRSQDILRTNRQTLQLFVDYAPAAIAMFDLEMRYIAASRRFISDYNIGDQDVIGRSHYEIFPEISQNWKNIHQRCLAGAVEKNDEDPFPRADGSLDWVRWEIRPWHQPTGEIGGILLFSEVITERKRAQLQIEESKRTLEQRVEERTNQLRQSNAELTRANRAKDEFLSAMSHELRTPLNGILGLSESLQLGIYGYLDERQQRVVGAIHESGDHLLSLINDILDISKAESGHMDLQFDLVVLNDVVESALRLVNAEAVKKNLRIHTNLNASSRSLSADGRRLKQMLVNLLSNAVKFTPENGQVGLEVANEPGEEALRFTVWDTGIGIPGEKIERLFQPFVQLDSSLSREYTGSGLGLALVRQLADLHGGSVGVDSEVGHGSRFWIILPVNQAVQGNLDLPTRLAAPAAPTPVAPLEPDQTLRAGAPEKLILVAEDNPVNQMSYMDYLKAKGYSMISAWNGQEAIARAQEYRPDLILMDVQMPVIDGLEAIRRLRGMPSFSKMPIVALTALAMPGDKERCLSAGASAYLAKPVGLRKLVELVEELLSEE